MAWKSKNNTSALVWIVIRHKIMCTVCVCSVELSGHVMRRTKPMTWILYVTFFIVTSCHLQVTLELVLEKTKLQLHGNIHTRKPWLSHNMVNSRKKLNCKEVLGKHFHVRH